VELVGSTLEVGSIVWMVCGFPRSAMKRLKAAINASVVRLVTTSMCTAFVAKQANIAM
jgi:hypothetical protein